MHCVIQIQIFDLASVAADTLVEKVFKHMNAKNTNIAAQRLQLRATLWPKLDSTKLWHRKQKQGFVTIPRTIPLILGAMDYLAPKGKPVGSTYLDLWCRSFDEMVVNLDRPQEMAFSVGFTGQRGAQTWTNRIDVLADLGFIQLAPGPYGRRSYALILNPYLVIKDLRKRLPESIYNALAARAATIKADDLTDTIVLMPLPATARRTRARARA